MPRAEEITRLRDAAERVARSHGLEIFDVQLRREPIGMVLRVVIDTPDPGRVETPDDSVGIADCQRVSQDLSALLDVEEDELETAAFGQAYTLEVSSPGLDRPLTKLADYTRFAGEDVQLNLHEMTDGARKWKGTLRGVEEDNVLLDTANGLRSFPLAAIDRCRLVPKIDWRKGK